MLKDTSDGFPHANLAFYNDGLAKRDQVEVANPFALALSIAIGDVFELCVIALEVLGSVEGASRISAVPTSEISADLSHSHIEDSNTREQGVTHLLATHLGDEALGENRTVHVKEYRLGQSQLPAPVILQGDL